MCFNATPQSSRSSSPTKSARCACFVCVWCVFVCVYVCVRASASPSHPAPPDPAPPRPAPLYSPGAPGCSCAPGTTAPEPCSETSYHRYDSSLVCKNNRKQNGDVSLQRRNHSQRHRSGAILQRPIATFRSGPTALKRCRQRRNETGDMDRVATVGIRWKFTESTRHKAALLTPYHST